MRPKGDPEKGYEVGPDFEKVTKELIVEVTNVFPDGVVQEAEDGLDDERQVDDHVVEEVNNVAEIVANLWQLFYTQCRLTYNAVQIGDGKGPHQSLTKSMFMTSR